jgi:hypothetical protein
MDAGAPGASWEVPTPTVGSVAGSSAIATMAGPVAGAGEQATSNRLAATPPRGRRHGRAMGIAVRKVTVPFYIPAKRSIKTASAVQPWACTAIFLRLETRNIYDWQPIEEAI